MRTAIDRAGRLVVPRELRDRVGLVPGPVDIEVDGAGLRIEPVAAEAVVEVRGRLLVAGTGTGALDDETVRRLRDATQR